MIAFQKRVFHADELERVDTSRMVILASGGPLMTIENIRTAGEFGVTPDAPTEALCTRLNEDDETEDHWFDVRALRMLVPFDLEMFGQ